MLPADAMILVGVQLWTMRTPETLGLTDISAGLQLVLRSSKLLGLVSDRREKSLQGVSQANQSVLEMWLRPDAKVHYGFFRVIHGEWKVEYPDIFLWCPTIHAAVQEDLTLSLRSKVSSMGPVQRPGRSDSGGISSSC